jgi:uncharacterized protein YqeY
MWDKLNNIIKESMKSKDSQTLSFARNLKSKVNEYLVAEILPRDQVKDDVVQLVASVYQKSLKKAILEFGKSSSDSATDLIKTYTAEIEFCNQFVPDDSESKEKVRELVRAAIKEVGGGHVGKLIGFVMKNNKGLGGALVKSIVEEELA